MRLSITFFISILMVLLSACQDGSLSDLNVTNENQAPISDAGEDKNVTLGALVTLDGSLSSDVNGDTLNYSWSIISKPASSTAALSSTTLIKPTFTADINGTYVIKLSVSDGVLESVSSDLVKIQTIYIPTANAGVDQNVNTLSLVTLDGSQSSVKDTNSLTYKWTLLEKPDESSAILSSSSIVKPTFNVDVDGEYKFSLIVSDATLNSIADEVLITATTHNSKPVANAGADKSEKIGSLITLDGSTSSDAENDSLLYRWAISLKPAQSKAILSSTTVVNPSFTADAEGTYVFDLIVNDSKVDSIKDSIRVNVTKYNVAPVAEAGRDQYVHTVSTITLDASLSNDADLDKLTYKWNMTSKPLASTATLSALNIVNPSFKADLEGTYVFSLIVNDGVYNSSYDYITINAADRNVAPVAEAGVDKSIKTGTSITLDASLSSDANLDPLSYDWVMISKPKESNANLSSLSIVKPLFLADKDGAYVFQLIVNDGELNSTADYITINAKTSNSRPTARAGNNQNIITLSTVFLNGAESSDPDPNLLSYIWHIVSKPSLSEAALSDPSKVNPIFKADKDGTYVVQLVVNDGITNSRPDTVIISANTINSKPVADAGVNQNIKSGNIAIVDASLSFDADYDVLSYSWIMVSKPDGSISSLSNSSLVNPTFLTDKNGTYVLGVSVDDGIIESNRAYTTVNATKTNSTPTARAGVDQNIAQGSFVTLNALLSSDADSDVLTYKWTIISKPSLSNAALSSTSLSSPTFTTDKVGAYVFELIVNDGQINSLPDYVTIDAI